MKLKMHISKIKCINDLTQVSDLDFKPFEHTL